MKTFNDLEFHPHLNFVGKQAEIYFENGYGASVVRFKTDAVHARYGSYTSNESEWELAVLIGDANDSYLCYTTDITDDVLGHLEEQDVTDVLIKIQQLPPVTKNSKI